MCVCVCVTCGNKSAFSQSLVGREVGNDDAVVTEVEICGHHLHSNCRVILNRSIVQRFLRLQPKYASNRCNNLQRKEGVCGRVDQWMLLSCLQYTVVNRPCGESNCCNGKQSTAAASMYFLWFMLPPHTVQCSTCYKRRGLRFVAMRARVVDVEMV